MKMQKDVCLCFIDAIKAFEKIRHKHLLELLRNFDLLGKDIRIIQNLPNVCTDEK